MCSKGGLQMDESQSSPTAPLRVMMLSTYVPRQCGIATYADDVIRAVEPHGAAFHVVAMERPGSGYAYDARVMGTIEEGNRDQYASMADMINASGADILTIQHEFGIYGGEANDDLLGFLEQVRLPTVATLHTVLQKPQSDMRRILSGVGRLVDRVVVMNGLIPPVLERVYGIDPARVAVIHHGAPVPTRQRGREIKTELGIGAEHVLSTFGLISPVKGLEYMVQAMPAIVARHPDAVYYILGETHPVVVQEVGETYRGYLENLAYKLGMLEHVRFVDHYLSKEELVKYLLATDVYVTPYLNLEQVTSGTLAYALGAGCPVVSTPYLHARYLVQRARGLLVPPRKAGCLAHAVLQLLDHPAQRHRIEEENWEFGKELYWPRVGAQYLEVYRQAITEHGQEMRRAA
jgi:glycosyltransferase involved in cell wall biosynthesis